MVCMTSARSARPPRSRASSAASPCCAPPAAVLPVSLRLARRLRRAASGCPAPSGDAQARRVEAGRRMVQRALQKAAGGGGFGEQPGAKSDVGMVDSKLEYALDGATRTRTGRAGARPSWRAARCRGFYFHARAPANRARRPLPACLDAAQCARSNTAPSGSTGCALYALMAGVLLVATVRAGVALLAAAEHRSVPARRSPPPSAARPTNASSSARFAAIGTACARGSSCATCACTIPKARSGWRSRRWTVPCRGLRCSRSSRASTPSS